MIRIILALLFLIPQAAFALDLKPPPGDLSISYLANIFGVVDGVLHGTGSQILGTMFGVFNAAILTLGIIVLSYIFLVSTINTAHEGEVLGKKWSSIWIPLRTIGGVALLLPKATGYSLIQIIVMWIVVQGVGAADAVWGTTIDYLKRGGSIIEPSKNVVANNIIQQKDIWIAGRGGSDGSGVAATYAPLKDNAWIILKAGDILKSEVCMYTLSNTLQQKYKKSPQTEKLPPDLTLSLVALGNTTNSQAINYNSDTGAKILFPGPTGDANFDAKYLGSCGSVSWDFIPSERNQINAKSINIANPAGLKAYDSQSVAVRQVILDLVSTAKSIANKVVPPTNLDPSFPDMALFNNSLVYAGADYIAIITPAMRNSVMQTNVIFQSYLDESKRIGWILAGSYYHNLVLLNTLSRSIGVNQDQSVLKPQFNPQYQNDKSELFKTLDASIANYLKANVPSGASACPNSTGQFGQWVCSEYGVANGTVSSANQINPNVPANSGSPGAPSGADQVLKVLDAFDTQFSALQIRLRNIQNSVNDPVMIVAQTGYALIYWVEQTWVTVTAVIIGFFIVSGIVSFFLGAAGTVAAIGGATVIVWLLPILGVCMVAALVTGATLAYYVPMIPFILFLFGAIGWLASVIEAMIAAPLIALGVTHPEGHDYLGKGEQGIMLIAGIFLRPMLMIFGFIGGIILSNVAIWLLNQGFNSAWALASNNFKDWFAGGLAFLVATFSIYTGIVLAIFNKSFALIYEVPDTILTWIGGPAQQKGGAQALEEIKGKLTKDVEVAGSTAQKGFQSTGEVATKLGVAASKSLAQAGPGGQGSSTEIK